MACSGRTYIRMLAVPLSVCILVYILDYLHCCAFVNRSQTSPKIPSTLNFPFEMSLKFPISTSKINHTPRTSSGYVMPLVTLFTTWPKNDKYYEMRNITLRNWANFKPQIKPLFFSGHGTHTKWILQHGWGVLTITKTAASGIPVLKNMFLDVMSKYKSPFYGYCNGDILFDDGLISTLLSVAKAKFEKDKPILIIGRRTNVLNVTKNESRDVNNLANVAEKRGELYRANAIDYFITDSSYPWSEIPDLVIGRNGYDNWLVINSRIHNHTVIDVTQTVLAIHQTTVAGNSEGHTRPNSYYNNILIRRLYNNMSLKSGCTWCSSWLTQNDGTHSDIKVRLSRRKHFAKNCKL